MSSYIRRFLESRKITRSSQQAEREKAQFFAKLDRAETKAEEAQLWAGLVKPLQETPLSDKVNVSTFPSSKASTKHEDNSVTPAVTTRSPYTDSVPSSAFTLPSVTFSCPVPASTLPTMASNMEAKTDKPMLNQITGHERPEWQLFSTYFQPKEPPVYDDGLKQQKHQEYHDYDQREMQLEYLEQEPEQQEQQQVCVDNNQYLQEYKPQRQPELQLRQKHEQRREERSRKFLQLPKQRHYSKPKKKLEPRRHAKQQERRWEKSIRQRLSRQRLIQEVKQQALCNHRVLQGNKGSDLSDPEIASEYTFRKKSAYSSQHISESPFCEFRMPNKVWIGLRKERRGRSPSSKFLNA